MKITKRFAILSIIMFLLTISMASAVTWSNHIGELTVLPDTARNPFGLYEQDAWLTLNYTIMANCAFVFDEQVGNGGVWRKELVAYEVPTFETNCTENNTYYESNQSWVNLTHCVTGQDGTELEWRNEWVDRKNAVEYYHLQNKHAYVFQNIQFQKGVTQELKWKYQTSSNTGKWDLHCWVGELSEWQTAEYQVTLDPFWNSSYTYRRDITLEGEQAGALVINNTGNFSGTKVIWTDAHYHGNATLYYNDGDDYSVAVNDTTSWYWETEGGASNNTPTNMYDSSTQLVAHMGELGGNSSGTVSLDSTSNNNDGTVYVAQHNINSECVWGGCYFFDADTSNSAANLNYGTGVSTPNTGFTYSLWFRIDGTSQAHNYIMTRDLDDNGDWALRFRDGEGLWANMITNAGNQKLTSNGTYDDGSWYMTTFVYDGSRAYLYVNGALASTSLWTVTGSSSDYIIVGDIDNDDSGAADGAWEMNNGYVDEVRIWSKGLSVNEVSELYNNSFTDRVGSMTLGNQEQGGVPTTVESGLAFENYTERGNLTLAEGEDFQVWANWTYSNGTSIGTESGLCNWSADNVAREVEFENDGVNVTICDNVGCDYNNEKSVVYELDTVGYDFDRFQFSLCRNDGIVGNTFTISSNCSFSYTYSFSEIPECDAGFIDFSVDDRNCSGQSSIMVNISSNANNAAQALVNVNNKTYVDRFQNMTETMDYNLTSGLWQSTHAHEIYDHGLKQIDVECYNQTGDIDNASLSYNVTVEDAPPQIIIDDLWNWLNGTHIFVDGVVTKYPLVSTLNVTTFVSDDDVDTCHFNLTNTSGFVIDNVNVTTQGIYMFNYTANNFSVNQIYNYTVWCNDSNSSVWTSKQFNVSNLEPVVADETISSPVFTEDNVTCSFNYTDDEGENGSITISLYKNEVILGTYNDGALENGSVAEFTFQESLLDWNKGDNLTCEFNATDSFFTVYGTNQTVQVGNTAPFLDQYDLQPSNAFTNDTLNCSAFYNDIDGDNGVAYADWFVNDVLKLSDNGITVNGTFVNFSLAPSYFNKSDVVICQLNVTDGTDWSNSTNQTVTINNLVPQISSHLLQPSPAYADTLLNCSATVLDGDSDDMNATFSYYVDDVLGLRNTFINVANGTYLNLTYSWNFTRGDVVICEVVLTDGDNTSSNNESLTIQNTRPTVESVEIVPNPAWKNDSLSCNANVTDIDGDEINLTFVWYRDGVSIETDQSTDETQNTTVTASLDVTKFNKTQNITCGLNATDGYNITGQTNDTIIISNLAPTITRDGIYPSPLTTMDNATCNGTVFDQDPGESLNVSMFWYVNGVNIYNVTHFGLTNNSVYNSTINHGNYSVGQVVECEAVAFDGTVNSTYHNVSATVFSSVPTIQNVTITDPIYTLTTVTCTITNVSNADAQNNNVTVYWYVNDTNVENDTLLNIPSGTNTSTTLAFDVIKGYNVTCGAFATYSGANGTTTNSSTVNVSNTVPVAAWTDGASVDVLTTPYNLSYTCTDPDEDDGVDNVTGHIYNSTILIISLDTPPFTFNETVESTYYFNLSCDDGDVNSTNASITVLFTQGCSITFNDPCDGCRYQDNIINASVSCANGINITTVKYAINNFANVTVYDGNATASINFLVNAEKGWNRYTAYVTANSVTVNESRNYWAKDYDADSFADYAVLVWASLIAALMVGIGMLTKIRVLVAGGGFGMFVIAYELMMFSMVSAAFAVVCGLVIIIWSMFGK